MSTLSNYIKPIRKNSLFINTSFYNISFRSMITSLVKKSATFCASRNFSKPPQIPRPANETSQTASMSCVRAFKPVSSNSKPLATDQTGFHTMGVELICKESNCEANICRDPCGDIISANIKGHATHKPINTSNDLLGPTDIKGNGKKQFFQRPVHQKKLSKTDLDNLTEDNLRLEKDATTYFNSTQDIIDKVKK